MLNILIQEAQQLFASSMDERWIKRLKRAHHQTIEQTRFPYLAKHCLALESASLHNFPYASVQWLGEQSVSSSSEILRDTKRFFLTPVHLVLQRDYFTMGPLSWSQLSDDESTALIATIQAHLAPEGYRVSLGQSGQWYIEMPTEFDLQTTVPHGLVFQDVALFQPRGKSERTWRAKLNELQMLLFEHPVNLAREQARRPIVNSVWLWGNGRIEGDWSVNRTATIPHQHYLSGLLALAPEASGQAWEVVQAAEIIQDSAAILERIRNARDGINLHLDLGTRMHTVKLRPGDSLKFWRSLPALFNEPTSTSD